MKRVFICLAALVATSGLAMAAELAYFQVHTPREGMTADEIMSVEYFVKYTKFAKDASFTGKALFIDKGGAVG